jgi:ADP-ribosylglycohydrolase
LNQHLNNALKSLDGLSVGDSFGQRFFGEPNDVWARISKRQLPKGQWQWTDDTAMARVIVTVLRDEECLSPNFLSKKFAEEYGKDPVRGYGSGTAQVLEKVSHGMYWMGAAGELFGGTGSKGNGGAMRVAPVGAYFYEDVDKVIEQAVDSARVTHSHPEGVAGAVAVALAAAWAARKNKDDGPLLDFVADRMPSGVVREGVLTAKDTPLEESPLRASEMLGNGREILAEDTVPFSLWCAARHSDDFVEAMWTTVSALGDRDTTCAIVGGIVALRADIPDDWLASREPLRLDGVS